jgi:hypothetical protein
LLGQHSVPQDRHHDSRSGEHVALVIGVEEKVVSDKIASGDGESRVK